MSTNQAREDQVISVMKKVGAICLFAFPLILILGYAMHENFFQEFFVFEFTPPRDPTVEYMQEFRESGSRYVMEHSISYYLGMPLMIPAALGLGYFVFKKSPWLGFIGGLTTCIGTIFMAGVFGIFLSFEPIGHVSQEQVAGAIPALEKLIHSNLALDLTSILSSLQLIGFLILAVALFKEISIPKWNATLFGLGLLLIGAFQDMGNFLFVGTFFAWLGVLPAAVQLFREQSNAERVVTNRPF